MLQIRAPSRPSSACALSAAYALGQDSRASFAPANQRVVQFSLIESLTCNPGDRVEPVTLTGARLRCCRRATLMTALLP